MKTLALRTIALTFLLCAACLSSVAGTVNYNLEITTTYQLGCNAAAGATFAFGWCGSPETGAFIITNKGTSAFVGTIGDIAVSQLAGSFSKSKTGTLLPGQSVAVGVSGESSNMGGFNGPFNNGTPQPGVQIFLNGNFVLGANSQAVNLSVWDKDIHSGVFWTNKFGVTLDNYVLQGGDPYGRDPGDADELAQANGHYSFIQTPEPSSVLLMFSGLGALAARFRRKK